MEVITAAMTDSKPAFSLGLTKGHSICTSCTDTIWCEMEAAFQRLVKQGPLYKEERALLDTCDIDHHSRSVDPAMCVKTLSAFIVLGISLMAGNSLC
jgi:hypothetical protein